MDSGYSAVPKEKFVELQLQNNDSSTLIPVASNGYTKPSNGVDPYDGNVDIDDSEFDNYPSYPLIVGGIGKGSGVPGAVFNLTTSIIGAGIMALPAAMGVLGLGLGMVLIVVIGVLSEISVELLVRFAVHCKATSYGEVVQFALGRPARILSEICIIVNNAGVLVVYLIIIGDVMSGSYHHIGVFDQMMGNGVWDKRKLVILVVLIIFLAPLCALEKIDSLSLTSAASVALAVVFVVVTCSIALVKVIEGKIDPPRMTPDFSSKKAIVNLLVVIPVMTNAYVCHFNVQPIYNELDGRSPQKMNRVVRITTLVTVVIYGFTAFSGYLLFGKNTESDVLTNFDTDLGIPYSAALNYIIRIGYILHLVLVFPVIHFSLREAVNDLFFSNSPLHESRKRLYILTSVLLALLYLGSTMIPSIWTAFKFTGATSAVSLGFIFPCLIALRLNGQGQSLSHGEKFFSWTMLIVAAIVGIIGVIGNVYGLQDHS
ncbi:amino acid transporter AVT6E [Beta vulgaris subsp. vulgaris]|uniref:amino acid transporter AVT6E n=1 Tax=Beta vulgaris subsp. vulgaris TaxID=3555 RepID=UPI0020373D0B|nr:amino acid transporter AVT6E [Beta vulgaris subsp. vulgaris]